MTTEDDIEFPQDDRKSRINRPPKAETPDDVTSAAERIEAFWEKHPDGSILPEVEGDTLHDGENLPYRVYTVRAFIRKDSQSDKPDSVAHATRGERDPDPLTAQFAQETAETSAISRALRNLGILPHGRGANPSAPAPASVPVQKVVVAAGVSALAIARQAANMSQKQLAEKVSAAGIPWSQAVVSKVERGNRTLRPAEVSVLSELIGYTGS